MTCLSGTRRVSPGLAGIRGIKKDSLDKKVDNLEKTMLLIKLDHGKKLDALFDGYKQNTEQLVRIKREVSKHEEVFLRRINN